MKFNYQSHSLKPGIYKITNTSSNRIYIGQAQKIKNRWQGHSISLRGNKHQNKFLQNDFNKCKEELGHDDFLVFEVIEVMEGSTKEERNKREEWWISQHYDDQAACYNFKEKVEGKERSCFSLTPEETKRKQSAAHKANWENPEFREKIIASQKERWADEEYKRDMLQKLHGAKQEALQTPGYREALGAKISATKSRPEAVARTAEETKQRWSNPEFKEKVTAKIKEASGSEEGRKARHDAFERLRSDPEKYSEYQRKASEHAKRLWDEGVIPREFTPEVKAHLSTKAKERIAAGKMEHLKTHSFKPRQHKVLDPQGQELVIENLVTFCRENNLEYDKFRRMANGGCKSYAGYTSLLYPNRDTSHPTPNGFIERLKAARQES